MLVSAEKFNPLSTPKYFYIYNPPKVNKNICIKKREIKRLEITEFVCIRVGKFKGILTIH